MKQKLTFVHPVTLSHREVTVGPDHLMIAVGVLAGSMRIVDLAGDLALPASWYAVVILIAHARLLRHTLTWPMLGSIALAFASFGTSTFFSGMVINQLIAQHWRHAGWKVRNTDGQLGEYSSRYMAIDLMGLDESDLLSVVEQQRFDDHQDAVPHQPYVGSGAARRRPHHADFAVTLN